MKELSMEISLPINIYRDSKLRLLYNLQPIHERTKHIEIDCHSKEIKLRKR